MMKKDFNKVLRNEKGFTLIEIIVVLIILGILAAIIVPKYFGLEREAGEKAAKGVVAELQARGNLLYATALMRAETPEEYYTQNEDQLIEEMGDYQIEGLSPGTNNLTIPGTPDTCSFEYERPQWDVTNDEDSSTGPVFTFTGCGDEA
jgi:prepilin-type N-terminal cleavage/methylation domain-containing protein